MNFGFDPALGVAFEGCACRAAFHVGALEFLTARGFRPAAVAGASSGSLVAAQLALGRVDRMREAWSELMGAPICDWRRLLEARWPFQMTEIVSAAARRHFGDAVMADVPVPLGIPVTLWDKWRFRRHVVTSRDRLRIAAVVQASCFFPGPYWRMVPVDGQAAFDGAWLERVPVDDVARLGAGKVIACTTNIEGRLLRGAIRPRDARKPEADFRVLHPIAPLALGAFDFDPGRSRAAFDSGWQSAAAFVTRHREWLSAR